MRKRKRPEFRVFFNEVTAQGSRMPLPSVVLVRKKETAFLKIPPRSPLRGAKKERLGVAVQKIHFLSVRPRI